MNTEDTQADAAPVEPEVTDSVTPGGQQKPPPSTYDPARVLAIGQVTTPRLDEIARSFAERCAASKELPRPEQLRSLLIVTRVANCDKVLPRFQKTFWREMSRLSGIGMAELIAKASSLPDPVQPEPAEESA
jgi:hypothetical protein